MRIRRSLVVLFLVAAFVLAGAGVVLASANGPGHAPDNATLQATDLSGTFVAPAVLAAQQGKTTYWVYTTNTGACYHRHYCVDEHPHYKHTVKQAKAMGLRACKVCRP
jgi:hypothetical protein